MLMEIVCACSWWGPPGGQKCDLIWHYTWGWECNVPTKLQPVASLCLCHALRHNHISNTMWQEHDYQTPFRFAALCQQQQTKDGQSINITEYSYCGGANWIWGYSHVYFLCEMWGNTRCVNIVGCYGSRLIGAVACTNTIYHKPNKVKQ